MSPVIHAMLLTRLCGWQVTVARGWGFLDNWRKMLRQHITHDVISVAYRAYKCRWYPGMKIETETVGRPAT